MKGSGSWLDDQGLSMLALLDGAYADRSKRND
jgi:hypothetical protein